MSIPPDREFGAMKDDGSWSGMVGLTNAGLADLIVASLDNTVARGTVVNFLVPFDMTRSYIVKYKFHILKHCQYFKYQVINKKLVSYFLVY